MASAITIQVSQTPTYYWGECGEYGPFRMQQEGPWAGWPDFGEVMHLLFGLAVLQIDIPITDPPKSHPVIGGQSTLKRVATDIDKYQADIRLRWQLYATSDAGHTFAAIEVDLQVLERLETQAKGDFLLCVCNV